MRPFDMALPPTASVAERRYRPEIDGLRAVAVLPVILFHAGFSFFAGGFVGVDIFFVISGYLITNILYDEVSGGRFSLVRFYERRARRLLPALFLVLVVTSVFAWLWLTTRELRDYGKSVVAVNLFASNILFWRESGYFGAASEYKPLLHTWSLAVEEQFYLIFPWIVVAMRRASRSAMIAVVLAITLVSFGLAEHGSRQDIGRTFFLLHARAWELGVGALIALWLGRSTLASPKIGNAGSILGLALIVVSIVFIDGSHPYPSAWTLPPVLGSALIICCATPQTLVGRLLSSKAFVGIGLISYSAYLWHQPLFVLARIRSTEGVPPEGYLALSVLTLGLAYLTWRFVEQPFRRADFISRRNVFICSAAGSALLIAFGLLVYLSGGMPSRLGAEAQRLAGFAHKSNPRTDECMGLLAAWSAADWNPADSCVYNAPLPAKVALFGDSHADAIATGLADAIRPFGLGLRELATGGCRPVLDWGSERCADLNRKLIDYIKASDEIETVVVTGRYALTLEGTMFDNGEGGVEFGGEGSVLASGQDGISDADRISTIGESFRLPVLELLEAGKRVVLIYPVPEVGWDVPMYLARREMFGQDTSQPLSTSYELFLARTQRAYAQLDMLPSNPNLLVVKPEHIFCNAVVPGRCVAEIDSQPLYRDDDHLGNVGADLVGKEVARQMAERGWTD